MSVCSATYKHAFCPRAWTFLSHAPLVSRARDLYILVSCRRVVSSPPPSPPGSKMRNVSRIWTCTPSLHCSQLPCYQPRRWWCRHLLGPLYSHAPLVSRARTRLFQHVQHPSHLRLSMSESATPIRVSSSILPNLAVQNANLSTSCIQRPLSQFLHPFPQSSCSERHPMHI